MNNYTSFDDRKRLVAQSQEIPYPWLLARKGMTIIITSVTNKVHSG
ncbi:MAG: hypothetical protein R6X32_14910 [Chloroflexota bacterium]